MEALALLIFSALVLGSGILILFLSRILGPRRDLSEKLDTYECGVEPVDSSRERFNVHFYMVAIVFMLFDIETAFLVPWAIHRGVLGGAALAEIIIFVVVLLVGLFYVVKRGVLEFE